jgi:Flp pilus assembly protein TadB
MYIILIAWLYVTVLMAVVETSLVAGVLTFVFYGLLPASLFWWLLGGRRQLRELKRQRQAYRLAQEANQAIQPPSLSNQTPHQGNRSNASPDQ